MHLVRLPNVILWPIVRRWQHTPPHRRQHATASPTPIAATPAMPPPGCCDILVVLLPGGLRKLMPTRKGCMHFHVQLVHLGRYASAVSTCLHACGTGPILIHSHRYDHANGRVCVTCARARAHKAFSQRHMHTTRMCMCLPCTHPSCTANRHKCVCSPRAFICSLTQHSSTHRD